MMWWIAALLFLILALDVIVKSTGASAKTAISSSTEFIGAVADNRSVPTHEFPAFGGNVSTIGRRFRTPPIRAFEWNRCTWSQRVLGVTRVETH